MFLRVIILLNLEKLETLYVNKTRCAVFTNDSELQHFSTMLNFYLGNLHFYLWAISMEMLPFTSDLDGEKYRNICDFGDVHVLVTI